MADPNAKEVQLDFYNHPDIAVNRVKAEQARRIVEGLVEFLQQFGQPIVASQDVIETTEDGYFSRYRVYAPELNSFLEILTGADDRMTAVEEDLALRSDAFSVGSKVSALTGPISGTISSLPVEAMPFSLKAGDKLSLYRDDLSRIEFELAADSASNATTLSIVEVTLPVGATFETGHTLHLSTLGIGPILSVLRNVQSDTTEQLSTLISEVDLSRIVVGETDESVTAGETRTTLVLRDVPYTIKEGVTVGIKRADSTYQMVTLIQDATPNEEGAVTLLFDSTAFPTAIDSGALALLSVESLSTSIALLKSGLTIESNARESLGDSISTLEGEFADGGRVRVLENTVEVLPDSTSFGLLSTRVQTLENESVEGSTAFRFTQLSAGVSGTVTALPVDAIPAKLRTSEAVTVVTSAGPVVCTVNGDVAQGATSIPVQSVSLTADAGDAVSLDLSVLKATIEFEAGRISSLTGRTDTVEGYFGAGGRVTLIETDLDTRPTGNDFTTLQTSIDTLQTEVDGTYTVLANQAVATLSATVSGTRTTLPVLAIPGTLKSGTDLLLQDKATGAATLVKLSADALLNATTLNINSKTVDAEVGSFLAIPDYVSQGQIQTTADSASLAATLTRNALKTTAETTVTGAQSGTVTSIQVSALPFPIKANETIKVVSISGDLSSATTFTVPSEVAAAATTIPVVSKTATLGVGDAVLVPSSNLSSRITANVDGISAVSTRTGNLETEFNPGGRVAVAEGRLDVNADSIKLAVLGISATDKPVAVIDNTYSGIQTSLSVQEVFSPLKSGDKLVVVDPTTGALTQIELSADVSLSATSLPIVSKNVTISEFSKVYGGSRAGIDLALEGITVESDIVKSSSYDGTQGWAWFGTGAADILGRLRTGGGQIDGSQLSLLSRNTAATVFNPATGAMEATGSSVIGQVAFGTTLGATNRGELTATDLGVGGQSLEVKGPDQVLLTAGVNSTTGDLTLSAYGKSLNVGFNGFTLTGLPTTNPGGTGRLWNDAGTLKIT